MTNDVIGWAQAVLAALNVGDVKSGSPLHLKLREAMITYRDPVRQIVEALKADVRRDIYESATGWRGETPSGEYWITYQGGGPFTKDVVMCMVKSGTLKRRYENGECYHLANASPVVE